MYRAWWIALILLLGAGVGPSNAAATAALQDEHLGARCAACHLAGEAVTAENAERLTATQEWLCGACHQGAVQASHPTGFAPGRPLPANMPLDWKREMTCSTCHDVHKAGGGSVRAGAATTGDRGAFCMTCHPSAFFDGMADGGESLIHSAHLDARANRPAQEIDGYSLRCLECHQDRLSMPGEAIRVAFTASNGTGMANHPIGMSYTQADLERGLRSPSALPAEVLLPDGQVSCVSCHNGYSARHGAEVVVGSTDPCMTCHDK